MSTPREEDIPPKVTSFNSIWDDLILTYKFLLGKLPSAPGAPAPVARALASAPSGVAGLGVASVLAQEVAAKASEAMFGAPSPGAQQAREAVENWSDADLPPPPSPPPTPSELSTLELEAPPRGDAAQATGASPQWAWPWLRPPSPEEVSERVSGEISPAQDPLLTGPGVYLLGAAVPNSAARGLSEWRRSRERQRRGSAGPEMLHASEGRTADARAPVEAPAQAPGADILDEKEHLLEQERERRQSEEKEIRKTLRRLRLIASRSSHIFHRGRRKAEKERGRRLLEEPETKILLEHGIHSGRDLLRKKIDDALEKAISTEKLVANLFADGDLAPAEARPPSPSPWTPSWPPLGPGGAAPSAWRELRARRQATRMSAARMRNIRRDVENKLAQIRESISRETLPPERLTCAYVLRKIRPLAGDAVPGCGERPRRQAAGARAPQSAQSGRARAPAEASAAASSSSSSTTSAESLRLRAHRLRRRSSRDAQRPRRGAALSPSSSSDEETCGRPQLPAEEGSEADSDEEDAEADCSSGAGEDADGRKRATARASGGGSGCGSGAGAGSGAGDGAGGDGGEDGGDGAARKAAAPAAPGPLLAQSEISSSQMDFFRMLDEKIESGPDYDSGSEEEKAAERARLRALLRGWETASQSSSTRGAASAPFTPAHPALPANVNGDLPLHRPPAVPGLAPAAAARAWPPVAAPLQCYHHHPYPPAAVPLGVARWCQGAPPPFQHYPPPLPHHYHHPFAAHPSAAAAKCCYPPAVGPPAVSALSSMVPSHAPVQVQWCPPPLPHNSVVQYRKSRGVYTELA